MPDGYPWILVGYFNLMRSLDNRNRPGGDINEMFMFNEAISALGLVELPLTGRKYTRTNKQNPPLLERLDWFFTSVDWTILYPDSSVSTLSMETSDHVPCIVSISTNIPKGGTFRFENYLMEHDQFLNVVQHAWSLPIPELNDMAKIIAARFKNVRRVIKAGQSHLSSLKVNISNVKSVIIFISLLEKFRDLTVQEWNFRKSLEVKLLSLLKQQRIYWKQRGTFRWVIKGDASTKIFHASATIKHRKSLITSLMDLEGNP